VQLHDLPGGARIVPGMPVQADIKVGQRTVMRYLMSRFIPPPSVAMREP
jgi:HlyD family secretion protein